MADDLKAFLHMAIIVGCLIATNAVTWYAATWKRDRLWSRQIVPQIRQMERINALAPKNEYPLD